MSVEKMLPARWELKRLGEVCDVSAGQSPEGRFYNDKGVGLPFYQGKKEFTDFYIGSPTTWTTEITKEAQAGDILMSVRAPVGPVNFATERICIGRGLASIRPSVCISSRYLFFFLRGYESNITGNAGAVFPSINKSQIESISIPLPPLSEQKRIVAILDEAFQAIDRAKENAEKNLANAREVFDGYLNQVFSNPGKDWQTRELSEIGEACTGTTPKPSEKENYGSFMPFITPADINISGCGDIYYKGNGLSEIGVSKARLIQKSSILMVCIGASIGKVGFSENQVTCNQQINTLTLKPNYHPKFFYYALSCKDFYLSVLRNSAQATLPIINKGKWIKLKVTFPARFHEQLAISSKFDALSSETRCLESIYQQKIAALDELKKSILQKAFSGEL